MIKLLEDGKSLYGTSMNCCIWWDGVRLLLLYVGTETERYWYDDKWSCPLTGWFGKVLDPSLIPI